MSEQFTVWVTKWALTKGIYQATVEDCLTASSDMVKEKKVSHGANYFHGLEWHRTKEQAVKQAEEMRVTKLRSLDKQINRIRELKFR